MGRIINTSPVSYNFYINASVSEPSYGLPAAIPTNIPGPIYAKIKNIGASTLTVSSTAIIFYYGQPGLGSPYTIATISPNQTKYFVVGSRYFPSQYVVWSVSDIIVKDPGSASIKKQNLGGGRLLAKPFLPNDLNGLSLWLRADYGVIESASTFVSQIVLTDAGTPSSNGTYTRAAGGGTTLNGPNGNYIQFSSNVWFLYDTTYEGFTYYNDSFDLNEENWNQENAPEPPTAVNTISNGPNVVTSWLDQSNGEKNANESIIPPIKIENEINGLPVISFDASRRGRMVGPNVISSVPATIFAVVKFLTVQEVGMVFQQYDSYDNLALYRGFNSGSSRAFRMFNGENLESTIETDDNTPLLLGSLINQQNSKLFYNGQEISTISTGPVNTDVGNLTPEGNYYLGYWRGNLEPKTVKIAEVIVYNRAITTQERQKVGSYLNAKYNIY